MISRFIIWFLIKWWMASSLAIFKSWRWSLLWYTLFFEWYLHILWLVLARYNLLIKLHSLCLALHISRTTQVQYQGIPDSREPTQYPQFLALPSDYPPADPSCSHSIIKQKYTWAASCEFVCVHSLELYPRCNNVGGVTHFCWLIFFCFCYFYFAWVLSMSFKIKIVKFFSFLWRASFV